MNSKQRRKDERYKKYMINEFLLIVREVLKDIKDGKSNIDEAIASIDELRVIMTMVK